MTVPRLVGLLSFLPGSSVLMRLVRVFGCPGPALRRRLTFTGGFSTRAANGTVIRFFNQRFYLENEIFWQGLDGFAWERDARRIWSCLASQADVVLDIGANSGIYSVLAKAYHPSARVLAFEPQPNVFRVLRKNCEINRFDVQCENIALSDIDGERPFYNYGRQAFVGNTTAGSLNPAFRREGQRSITVPVRTLKDVLVEQRVEKVDLIKLDVETHEPEVLRGYGELLADHQPTVLLEVQDRRSGQQVEALLPTSHYHYYRVDEGQSIRRVEALGASAEHLNHLVVPVSRQHAVAALLGQFA